MTTGVKRVTPNLGLIIPTFDTPLWGSYMEQNFDILDAQLVTVTFADARYVKKAGDAMSGDLTIDKASPALIVDKAASGQTASVKGQTNGVARWTVNLGNATSESGSQAGSNLSIERYSDTGVLIDIPLTINRASGRVSIITGPSSGNDVAHKTYVDTFYDSNVAAIALKANINSPTFTGDPKAPTPATADNDTSIATTAYVQAQGYATPAQLSTYAPIDNPALTGIPTAPTAAAATNTTQIATTQYVKSQGYVDTTTANSTYVNAAGDSMTGALQLPSSGSAAANVLHFGTAGTGIYGTSGGIYFNVAASQMAYINGTTFVTQVPVQALVGNFASPSFSFSADTSTGMYRYGAGVIGWTAGGTAALQLSNVALTSVVPILAPTSSTTIPSIRLPHGVAPTTPTNGDVWTTTAGMYARINGVTAGPFGSASFTPSDTNPIVNGTAAPGVSANYTRGDHVHPTDTSRAPIASPDFTGDVSLPTSGTAAATSLNFGTNGTGVYGTASQWNFAIGGTQRAYLTSAFWVTTVQNATAGGTQNAPAYAFSSNADMGMYRAGLDILGFSTLQVLRLSISTTDITSTLPITLPSAPTVNLHAATKLYVDNAVAGVSGGGTPSSTNPIMDGVAAPGVLTTYARGDHVHPSDTSKEPTISTGTTSQFWRGDKSWQTVPSTPMTASEINTVLQAANVGNTLPDVLTQSSPTDWNTLTVQGWADRSYRGSYTNGPGGTQYYFCHYMTSSTLSLQYAYDTTTADIYARTYNGSAWGSWFKINASGAGSGDVTGPASSVADRIVLFSGTTGKIIKDGGILLSDKLDTSAYTAADVLAKLLTVDGSGSLLDADYLDGQSGAHYLQLTNTTGILPSARFDDSSHGSRSGGTLHADVIAAGASGFMSGADKTKLNGVATGATANSSDATLLARGNHTGTQTASTISDFSTAADARITAAVGTTVQAYDADLTSWSAITPASKLDASAYTAADVLAKLLTVDGTGSGLDADTLDGISSAGFVPVANLAVKITVSSSAPGSPATNDVWIDTT